MTIVASGALRTGALRAEYGGGTPMRLGSYARGHSSKFVRANSGDNAATNMSANVPAQGQPIRMGHFYGQAIGWTYTNSAVQINNYYPHGHFGSDWLGANGTNWPCFYINNNGVYSTSTSYYAMIIYARQNNGPCTFTNNSEIQGAGGAPNSGAGQHAIYLYNSENASYANRPVIINNYAIRGGGGAGGIGGTGGTGGQGYTQAWSWDPADTSYVYARNSYCFQGHQVTGGYWRLYWGGALQVHSTSATSPPATYDYGGWTYEKGSLREQQGVSGGTDYWYQLRRRTLVTNYYGGGAGGGGGNGGRGIGYNSPNQGGNGGAPGAGGGPNAGSGGYGGTGGTGGSWGEAGQTGATGATGNGGNSTGGAAGAGGAAGGAAGGSVYAATQWGFANNNTAQGPWWYGVGNS
jgi:hypothetical protein